MEWGRPCLSPPNTALLCHNHHHKLKNIVCLIFTKFHMEEGGGQRKETVKPTENFRKSNRSIKWSWREIPQGVFWPGMWFWLSKSLCWECGGWELPFVFNVSLPPLSKFILGLLATPPYSPTTTNFHKCTVPSFNMSQRKNNVVILVWGCN